MVAEQKSLGAASRILHVSQSSLTKNIKKLESQYNAPLFERHSRGVNLTEFGKVLYNRCINIEREYQYAVREIDTLRHHKDGHLVVGLGISYALIIPPVLERMYAHFPHLKISLISGSVQDFLPDLVAGRIDFLLGGTHGIDAADYGVAYEHIMHIDHALIVRKQHPLVDLMDNNGKILLADLKSYPWIQFQYSSDQTIEIQDFMHKNNQPMPNVVLQSNFLRTAHALLQRGNYIMNVPRPVLFEAGDDIIELKLDVQFLGLASGAFFVKGRHEIPYIQIFLKYLKQML